MRFLRLVLLVLLVFSSSACMSTQFLADPSLKEVAVPRFPGTKKFAFGSAVSEMEHSTVEVGAWKIRMSGGSIIGFDLKIINKTDSPVMTPDEVTVFDAGRRTMRILSPNHAMAVLYGITPESGMATSSAMMNYSSALAASQPAGGSTYTYGSFSPGYFGNVNYQGTSYYQPAPNYGATFASNMGMAYAVSAADMSQKSGLLSMNYLRREKTYPGSANFGKISILKGEFPLELHVYACGDHHIIPLDKIQKGVKRIRPSHLKKKN